MLGCHISIGAVPTARVRMKLVFPRHKACSSSTNIQQTATILAANNLPILLPLEG